MAAGISSDGRRPRAACGLDGRAPASTRCRRISRRKKAFPPVSCWSCSARSRSSPPPCLPTTCRRSEEHTSELQSRVDLVCRLLLEKKKDPLRRHGRGVGSDGPRRRRRCREHVARRGRRGRAAVPEERRSVDRHGPLFFFHDTATTEIYTLSLHDALPICPAYPRRPRGSCRRAPGGADLGIPLGRSEEHTSELQSRVDLVCRLLLEKK